MAQEHKSAGDVLSDVFSQAKDGLMSFGETIANKSKEAYDSAKLNTQKAQLESENEEYYKQLGKMVKDRKIDENESELQKLDAQINGEEVKEDQKDEAKGQQAQGSDQEPDSETSSQTIENRQDSADSSSSEPEMKDSSKEEYKYKENPVTGTQTEEIKVKNSDDTDFQSKNTEQGQFDRQASGTKTTSY